MNRTRHRGSVFDRRTFLGLLPKLAASLAVVTIPACAQHARTGVSAGQDFLIINGWVLNRHDIFPAASTADAV